MNAQQAEEIRQNTIFREILDRIENFAALGSNMVPFTILSNEHVIKLADLGYTVDFVNMVIKWRKA